MLTAFLILSASILGIRKKIMNHNKIVRATNTTIALFYCEGQVANKKLRANVSALLIAVRDGVDIAP